LPCQLFQAKGLLIVVPIKEQGYLANLKLAESTKEELL